MSAHDDADRRFAELLRQHGFPSVPDTLTWLEERLANCLRFAEERTGDVRDGWLDDARYFAKTLAIIRTLAGVAPPQPTSH